MILTWVFIGVQALTLTRLVLARYPYKFFLLALALWTMQACNVATAVPTAEWTRTWWRYPEIAVVLASCLAVVESIERERQSVASYRGHLLRMASIAIPLCVVFSGAWFVSPLSGDSQDKFNQVRAWIWAYLALSMVVTQLLLVMETGRRERSVVAHSLLLMAVMLAHAAVAPLVNAPDSVWYAARNWRWVVIGCCLIWLTCFRRGPGESLQFRIGWR